MKCVIAIFIVIFVYMCVCACVCVCVCVYVRQVVGIRAISLLPCKNNYRNNYKIQKQLVPTLGIENYICNEIFMSSNNVTQLHNAYIIHSYHLCMCVCLSLGGLSLCHIHTNI
jgi:hypothetical protein